VQKRMQKKVLKKWRMQVLLMSRNKEKRRAIVTPLTGDTKRVVGVKLILKETGKLIECAEKNGEEEVEEKKSASTTDVPEQEEK